MPFLRVSTLKQRAQALAVAGALVLTTWPAAAGPDAGRQALGEWRLTRALDASDITALDELEAQQLLGSVVAIHRNGVHIDGRNCDAPSLRAERVVPSLYLREHAHADAAKLGLPNPVTVVDLGCTQVFLKNPRRLVIHWRGWFFDALKVR
jgi:hypothetical protein